MKRVLVGYAEPKAEEGDRARGKKKVLFSNIWCQQYTKFVLPQKRHVSKGTQHNVSAVSILHNGTRGGINTSENT